LNTKITYEQQKFNLFRETSEGFSKLIFLLFETELNDSNVQLFFSKISSLIGFFDLDPIRVLDLVLSAFEVNPLNTNFIQIIKVLNINALPHVLGVKLSNSKKQENTVDIYIVISQLIKHDLMNLKDILAHFTATEHELEEIIASNEQSATNIYATLHSRILKEMGSTQNSKDDKEKEKDKDKEKESPSFIQLLNFEELKNEVIKTQKHNQYYRLMEGLIKVGDWNNAEVFFSHIESFYDPLASNDLIDTICESITNLIDGFGKSPTNKTTSQLNNQQTIKNIDDFYKLVPNILKYLSIGLSKNQTLFIRLLEIIKMHNKISFANYSEKVYNLFTNIFFPTLSITEPSQTLLTELWDVFRNFDYNTRYKAYNYWAATIYNTHPILYLKHGVTMKEAAKWQKTLTKDNHRSHGKSISALTNSNPVIVFDNIIRLLTTYDNQINLFMQTLSFISNLSYDVITYIISKVLADPTTEKLHQRSGEISSWFKYFCYFVGCFYKKYHFAEFSGIFYFLCNQLKNNPSSIIDLYIIKEILDKMSGIPCVEEMNESQLTAFAGGLYLYLETNGLMKEYKYLKKPVNALKQFFIENGINKETSSDDINGGQRISFTSIFLILLGTRRQNIIFNSSYNQPKFIGYLYDIIHNIYIQLIIFFNMYLDKDTFTKILPKWSMEKYVLNYNCQPEVIYFMLRNQIKPVYNLNQSEYKNYIQQFCLVLDTYQSYNLKHFENEFESMYYEKKGFLNETYKNIWKYVTPEFYFIFSCLQLKDIYFPRK
jgi:THO complex subunit 2